MRAITYKSYGPPSNLTLQTVKKPTPKPHEVLIEVRSAGVNAGDWHLVRGKPLLMRLMGFGVFAPKHKILGADVAGVVESIGSEVTEFQPGDQVVAELSNHGFGGFAEFVAAPKAALAKKPASLTHEQAAAIPTSAITALQALRDKGHIKPGQKVAINGASGGVGSFAIQIAKALGATVTAICSASKADQARQLGASQVIDYKSTDFTKEGELYDVIHAVNGYHPLEDYKRALKPTGTLVVTGGDGRQFNEAMLKGSGMSKKSEQTFTTHIMEANQQDLKHVLALAEQNQITPIIQEQIELEKVPDAIQQTELGTNKGKIVVVM